MGAFAFGAFYVVLSMSITGALVILAVIAGRFLLTKAPAICSYLLWAVVLFRLLCPFSFESALGILPSNSQLPSGSVYIENPEQTTVETTDEQPQGPTEATENIQLDLSSRVDTFALLWLFGVLLMLCYGAWQYIALKRRLIGAVHIGQGIYTADGIDSPFVLGIFSPKIFLPSALDDSERDLIIAHERCHIKRFDHITRALAYFALTLHWYNPLVWVAFVLSGRDMERSCDQAVLHDLDGGDRHNYVQSLLRLSTGRKLISATPLAFGEGNPKNRIKGIVRYKNPPKWAITTAFALVATLTVALAFNQPHTRSFTMGATAPSQFEPEIIVAEIAEILGVPGSELRVSADNFGFNLDGDFNFRNNETIRFLYQNKSAQLRIYPEIGQCFVTEATDWVDMNDHQTFPLVSYLQALKNLPTEQLLAICEQSPDMWAVELIPDVDDYKYDKNRVLWQYQREAISESGDSISFSMQPMYQSGNGFSGVGSDIIVVNFLKE